MWICETKWNFMTAILETGDEGSAPWGDTLGGQTSTPNLFPYCGGDQRQEVTGDAGIRAHILSQGPPASSVRLPGPQSSWPQHLYLLEPVGGTCSPIRGLGSVWNSGGRARAPGAGTNGPLFH